MQSGRASKGSRGSKPSTSDKLVRRAGADKSNIKFMADSVERAPATIVQTGRDRLEVTVHPQSLTKRSDKAATASGEDDESDEEEESDSDSDSDNPFTTLMSASTDDESSDIDEEAVIGEFIASQLAQAGVHHGNVDRVEIQIRRDGADEGGDSSDDDSDDESSASTRTIDVTESSRKPSWETVVNNVLEVIKQLKQFAPEPGDNKQEQAKHARLLKKLDEVMQMFTDHSQFALFCTFWHWQLAELLQSVVIPARLHRSGDLGIGSLYWAKARAVRGHGSVLRVSARLFLGYRPIAPAPHWFNNTA